MNKNGVSKAKYCVQVETHAKNAFKGLCSLMEHQSLVDILICCGNNTIQAHKVVLAANSPLFREEFERNPQIEQVVINGCDFSAIRSILEVMYCGQTMVSEEYIKVFIAIVKLFQMKSLENLFLGNKQEFFQSGDEICIPKPQFLTKKPKFPAYSCNSSNSGSNDQSVLSPINYTINNTIKPYKPKKKLRLEAEQACVKEAQASRMALASLQKEIGTNPEVNNFIIEESCTETTVQNFIPHTEQPSYVQVIDYADLENGVFLPPTQLFQDHDQKLEQLSSDKIKTILGTDIPSNVEIMYKTSDGKFVTVTEEVLQNLSTKEGLQYQVVDEDGRVGEIQELQVIGKDKCDLGKDISLSSESNGLSASSSDCFIVEKDECKDAIDKKPIDMPEFCPDIFFIGNEVSVTTEETKLEKKENNDPLMI